MRPFFLRVVLTLSLIAVASCKRPPSTDSSATPLPNNKATASASPQGSPEVKKTLEPTALDVAPTTDGKSSGPTERRVEEIAAMLDEKPTGLGHTIEDRDWWLKKFESRSGKGTLKSATAMLLQPTPDLPDKFYLEFTTTGGRDSYEKPYQERAHRLGIMTRAECLENKGRFLPAIEAELAAILAEKTWCMPAHDPKLTNFNGTAIEVDLGVAMRAWSLATVDYALGNKLAEASRKQLRSELNRRVFQPYLKSIKTNNYRGMGWIRGKNNWNAVCHAGVVGSALAVVESRQERAYIVAAAEDNLRHFLDGYGPDGYCSEGINYWNYGFGHFTLLTEALLRATDGKLDFYESPRVALAAEFAARTEMQPGTFPAFTDSSPGDVPAGWLLYIINLRYQLPQSVKTTPTDAGQHPLGDMYYGAAILETMDDIRRLSGNTSVAPNSHRLRDFFPNGGDLMVRPKTDAPNLIAAALKAGHNDEEHNHNDVGSYVVSVNSNTLILDPGPEKYTSRTFSAKRYDSTILNSFGHSVPIVAGQLQAAGKSARGDIITTDFTDDRDVYAMEMKSAYPTVPGLQSMVRTFTYDRTGSTSLTVEDRVDMTTAGSFGTAIITKDLWKAAGEGTIIIYSSKSAIKVTFSSPQGKIDIKADTIVEGIKPTRIGLNLVDPVTQGIISVRIEPTEIPPYGVALDPDFQPQSQGNVVVQAEAFSKEIGGSVTPTEKVGAEGQALRDWNNKDHALTWRVNIPQGRLYAVQLRYCGNMQAERDFLIDGKLVGENPTFVFPSTFGWSGSADNWENQWLAQKGKGTKFFLSKGDHDLTFISKGQPMNLDWIRLAPVM